MTMLGVDTNVLLRLFVTDDDVSQSRQAAAFAATLPGQGSIFINEIVLVELLWSLRSQYGFKRAQLLDVVHALLERAEVEFASRELTQQALDLARKGADFSDALVAVRNSAAGCIHTVTFDQKAARLVPVMELLA